MRTGWPISSRSSLIHFMKGEEWAKALEYLLKAAQKAAQAFATREAVVLYEQALEAPGKLGAVVDARTLMPIHQAKMRSP